jgi:hypothetical protein
MALLQPDGTAAPDNGKFLTRERLITWLIAALLAYGTVHARVSVLESRVDDLRSDISEIKADVKLLIRAIR